MDNKLEKRYGLWTAISMVVGVVIGSGIFFKAEVVLERTGGNMPLGILAWLIVGGIMVVCTNAFASMANRYDDANGIVDYAHALLGNKYAYNLGWFMTTIYTPAICAVLCWVCARYTVTLFEWDITGGSCMTIAAFYLCLFYAINVLSPKVAGKLQVSVTFVKLIPIFAMAIVGTIAGFMNGNLVNDFANASSSASGFGGLMGAVLSVAFAFDGWILAVSINGELKDAKRNLPIALTVGSMFVVATYVLYYIGINGVMGSAGLLGTGENGVRVAFSTLFGPLAGTLVFVLITISCLGTFNGLVFANSRNMYTLAIRDEGPCPDMFKQVDAYTNMPTNSSIIGLAMAGAWLLYFYGANLTAPWFGIFSFDSSELPIVTVYAMYIPLFVRYMMIAKDEGVFKRFIFPVLSIAGCLFMVYASFAAYGVKTVGVYLLVFAVIMALGNFFNMRKN